MISRVTMFLRRELQVWVNLDVEVRPCFLYLGLHFLFFSLHEADSLPSVPHNIHHLPHESPRHPLRVSRQASRRISGYGLRAWGEAEERRAFRTW